MNQLELINYCNNLLNIHQIRDFCPNGMQVEGDNREVKKIALGVSISLEFIEKAIAENVDMIMTHHGLIWDKDPRVIKGPFRSKVQRLLEKGIAAATYHLPLDFHLDIGNNIQLANILEFSDISTVPEDSEVAEAVIGNTAQSTIEDFAAFIEKKLKRPPQVLPFGNSTIQKAVIITGGAQNYFSVAVDAGADCFITGEISEKNYSMSQEFGVHFISAGHYATERYGIQALGEHLKDKTGISSIFIEIENPI